MSLSNFKLLSGYGLPEVGLNIRTVEVRNGQRRIRAQWTPEMVQDLNVNHNIDAEAELMALLNQELTAEIDREVIRNIMRPIADDLVSVQPMGAPIGQLYYMDFVYDGYNFKKFKLLKG
jgi:hypothetical protein